MFLNDFTGRIFQDKCIRLSPHATSCRCFMENFIFWKQLPRLASLGAIDMNKRQLIQNVQKLVRLVSHASVHWPEMLDFAEAHLRHLPDINLVPSDGIAEALSIRKKGK